MVSNVTRPNKLWPRLGQPPLVANKLWATCNLCKGQTEMMVNINDYAAWEDDRGKPEGLLIQDAMPYLTADEREVLISGTCGECFDNMFPEPSESEISVEEPKS